MHINVPPNSGSLNPKQVKLWSVGICTEGIVSEYEFTNLNNFSIPNIIELIATYDIPTCTPWMSVVAVDVADRAVRNAPDVETAVPSVPVDTAISRPVAAFVLSHFECIALKKILAGPFIFTMAKAKACDILGTIDLIPAPANLSNAVAAFL